jgi:hypothetical protein
MTAGVKGVAQMRWIRSWLSFEAARDMQVNHKFYSKSIRTLLSMDIKIGKYDIYAGIKIATNRAWL